MPGLNYSVFFAQGLAVNIVPELDLVVVADVFSKDDKARVKQWMQNQQVHLVTDQQAALWIKNDALLWAVVIKPWVRNYSDPLTIGSLGTATPTR